MIDEADTLIEPKSFHVVNLASGSHLEALLQQNLYQQNVGTIVQQGMVWQPAASMNGHFLRLLVFHIDINETKWSI